MATPIDASTLSLLRPTYLPSTDPESPAVQSTITALSLIPHVEGGYYALTDLAPTSIPSPYPPSPLSEATLAATGGPRPGFDPEQRLLSSTIFYCLTPRRPQGSFHANRSRIVHTLHRGRGRYVLIHPDDGRVETFVVGQGIEKGERLQWVVEGGVYKASFLLPDVGGDGEEEQEQEESGGLLISETVVPGFEYADHEFLSLEGSRALLSADVAAQLEWLVKKSETHADIMGRTKKKKENEADQTGETAASPALRCRPSRSGAISGHNSRILN